MFIEAFSHPRKHDYSLKNALSKEGGRTNVAYEMIAVNNNHSIY